MKYFQFIFFSVIINLTVFAQTNNGLTVYKPDSAEHAKQLMINKNNELATLEKYGQDINTKLPLLLEKFTFKKVENSQSGWYHHKTIDTLHSFIETPVSIKGHIYIKAHYVADDYLTITKIRLKIANTSYESMPLLKTSKYITRRKASKAHEYINLFAYVTEKEEEVRTMNILAAIAQANETAEIIIVFIGEQDNFEITLTNGNVKAIRDSYYLSQYITYKSNDYITVSRRIHSPKVNTPTMYLIPKRQYTVSDMKGVVD